MIFMYINQRQCIQSDKGWARETTSGSADKNATKIKVSNMLMKTQAVLSNRETGKAEKPQRKGGMADPAQGKRG